MGRPTTGVVEAMQNPDHTTAVAPEAAQDTNVASQAMADGMRDLLLPIVKETDAQYVSKLAMLAATACMTTVQGQSSVHSPGRSTESDSDPV